MKQLIGYILIALLCTEFSFAESVDSLKLKFNKNLSDTSRVAILAQIGFEYAFSNSDSSRKYCKAAIELAKDIRFTRGQADALNNLAISYDIEGNHEVAITYFLEALDLYFQLDAKEGQARIYNNCGMVFQSLGDTLQSLKYHSKSLALEQELGDTLGIAYSLIQVAALHLNMDEYENSLKHYNSALDLLHTLNDSQGLAYVHWGLGELFMYTQEYSKAIEHSDKAFQYFQVDENLKGMAESTLIKGRTYLLQRNYNSAEKNLKYALEMSQKLIAKNVMLESFKSLTKLYKSQKKYDLALNFHEQLSALQDTILKSEMTTNIKEIQLKYDFDQQKQQIELLNTEKNFEAKIKNIAIAITIIIMVLLALLFWAYLSKAETMEVLKTKNHEIEKQHEIIKKEKENALAAAKAKSDFLSVMSHEIRTPMNVIIGSTYLLLEDNPKPNQLENINLLKFSAENLLTLLNDILDINKLESGKIELESVPFNLNLLLTGIVKGFEPEVRKKNIELKLEVDKDLPTQLLGDPGRLSQVLNNLVGNAIKFTEDGGVTLKIKLLKQSNRKAKLKFLVEDTGIGIPAEKQKLIFETFSQVSSDSTRKYGGTGLGLAITRQIIKLFGSEIELKSKPGKGSAFSFKMKFNSELIPERSYT